MQTFKVEGRTQIVFHGPRSRKPIHHLKTSKLARIQSNLQSLTKEYCSHSSIHGMSYIGSRRSLLERLWWIAVFVFSVYGCAKLIEKVYQKWTDNPVIVTFDERPLPVWLIPFPAVTICPEAKIRSSYMNFTEEFYRLNNYDGIREPLDQKRYDVG